MRRRTPRSGSSVSPRRAGAKRAPGHGRERRPRSGAPGTTAGPREVEGTLSAHRSGYGFVRSDALDQSVFLPRPAMRGLVHGDRVRVEVRSDAQGRYVGRLIGIVERGVQTFLGTLEAARPGLRVRAADQRVHLSCGVAENPVGAGAGDWVIARIISYPQPGLVPSARIEQRLDPERPVQMATEAAIARYGLPVEFPAEALREAHRFGQSIEPRAAAGRTDLRHLPLVTIDGEDARDFDDAVYAERLETGGFRLLVGIADVSHYVRPGSALDDEARARGTSVYFPNRVLPMLPTALSNHLCSLEPGVDRLCFVADMQISHRGALERARFYPAVMRSAARLTYQQVQRALFDAGRGPPRPLGVPRETLEPLVEVYRALAAARAHRGALDFDAPEAEFVIDDSERVRAIELRARTEAHRLIEECMVLANVAVAQELGAAGVPSLYRVHARPEQRKLEQLHATLRLLGIELTLPEPLRTRDLAGIAPRVRDPESRPFVESLIVRSLAQALYQPENIGHFGLALHDYTHFTSPIRRYPDLLVHRALRERLARGAAGPATPRDRGAVAPEGGMTAGVTARWPPASPLAALGAELSELERRADEADRFVSTFLKCVYLRDRIGQTFDGLITTVTEFGCFVQLLAFGLDGLLSLAALREDEYELARGGGQWLGLRGKRRLAPGVRLRVTVAAVRPVEGLIDLELAAD